MLHPLEICYCIERCKSIGFLFTPLCDPGIFLKKCILICVVKQRAIIDGGGIIIGLLSGAASLSGRGFGDLGGSDGGCFLGVKFFYQSFQSGALSDIV